tara:strand:- start:134 stop:862 length:729 start_codon:yes stop_codon:yes gene_type:complete
MAELKFPTEQVELPSKGLIYPKESPLSSGIVEMKYMTAKEEDILTNQAFIKKGIVLDKLLRSLVVSKDVNIDDLIVGDKNAILIASRLLGYGAEYTFTYGGEQHTVDLNELDNKPLDESNFTQGVNEFEYTLPTSKTKITYKLITGRDEKAIEREIAGLKKINKDASPELTTRLKQAILSVDGDSEKKTVREFVDNYLLAKDSRALREHIRLTQPDVDMNIVLDSGEEVTVPIGLSFFWPDY